MNNQPWKTAQWFVSPWNFADEVRATLHFPSQIKIHDITLRDGEQQAGIVFTKDDKIRIAEALAEAGVQRIEAGMAATSPSDAAAIQEIVKRNLGPQVFAFSRCMIEDVKRAVDCGVSGVVMEIPSSRHIIEYAYQWQLEKVLESIRVLPLADQRRLRLELSQMGNVHIVEPVGTPAAVRRARRLAAAIRKKVTASMSGSLDETMARLRGRSWSCLTHSTAPLPKCAYTACHSWMR